MENEKDIVVDDPEKPYNIRHRCFHFSKELIWFIASCNYERIHFSIFDQLVRSGTSIGANVVEGGSGSSKKDFIKFLQIALKSANETKYWLCLIRDCIEVDKNKLEELLKESNEISKIIAKVILNAR
jgi:four helix bundle protein